jgi:hypothetical protein
MEYGFKWETTKYYGSINQWKFIRNKTVVDKQYQDNRGYLDNNKRKVTDVDIKNMFMYPIPIKNGKANIGRIFNNPHIKPLKK